LVVDNFLADGNPVPGCPARRVRAMGLLTFPLVGDADFLAVSIL